MNKVTAVYSNSNVRIFYILYYGIIPGNIKPFKQVFTLYSEFTNNVKNLHESDEYKVNQIGYIEVDFYEFKKTYDLLINSLANTEILPETVFNETISYLYQLYYNLQKYTVLNLFDDNGRFLWK